ncbi:unnamed protein product [Closterium sp. Yama58-4]|nr:unnamed protein product [Closterium sp. Yama58-4]
MSVSGDNWQCSDVSTLVGIPFEKFRSTNAVMIGLSEESVCIKGFAGYAYLLCCATYRPGKCETLFWYRQPLAKDTVIQLGGAPDIPCTAFFYALKGDTCSSISSQLGLSVDGLTDLNPGLDCSPNGLKAGQSVCIERSSAFAYTVPECLRYGTVTVQTTCERLL